MILIISTCKNTLHELEFVKPIENILKDKKFKFKTINYKNLNNNLIKKSEKIIIAGTSLKDNDFLKKLSKFSFIKETNKPILGICAGMHIIGLIYKGKLKKQKQIGPIEIIPIEDFLGLEHNRKHQVYNLHGLYVDFSKIKNFKVYAYSSCNQAVKHNSKEIYGILFHPEVRNEDFILNFCEA